MILKAKSYKLKAIQGFTLIELIIYLAIVSTLATSLILWALTVNDLGARARGVTEVNVSGRFALAIITRDIEQAVTVTAPAAITPSPILTLTNVLGQVISISVSDNQLVRTVGAGNPLALTALPAQVTDFTVYRTTGPWSGRNSLVANLTLRTLPMPAHIFTTVANLRH